MTKFSARIIGIVLAVIIVLATLSFSTCNPKPQSDYYQIVLLSDTHLPTKKFEMGDKTKQERIIAAKNKVVDDVNNWQDVGEIAVLGDIVGDTGTPEEYAYAAQYFARFKKPVSLIVGNHDYIYQDAPGSNGRYAKGDAASRAAKLQRFKETFGLSELFYAKKTGNYLLVFLSADSLDSKHITQISEKQLAWLRETLRNNSSLATIIFFHAPLANTLSHYNKNANTPNFIAQPVNKIDEIIKENPQIVMWVSGHTHTSANNPEYASDINYYEGRVLNIHNSDMNREVIWTNSLFLYPDKIVIKTFNHKGETWMNELERTVRMAKAG